MGMHESSEMRCAMFRFGLTPFVVAIVLFGALAGCGDGENSGESCSASIGYEITFAADPTVKCTSCDSALRARSTFAGSTCDNDATAGGTPCFVLDAGTLAGVDSTGQTEVAYSFSCDGVAWDVTYDPLSAIVEPDSNITIRVWKP